MDWNWHDIADGKKIDWNKLAQGASDPEHEPISDEDHATVAYNLRQFADKLDSGEARLLSTFVDIHDKQVMRVYFSLVLLEKDDNGKL